MACISFAGHSVDSVDFMCPDLGNYLFSGGFYLGNYFPLCILRNFGPRAGPVLFLPVLTFPGCISPKVLVRPYMCFFMMSVVSP